MFCHFPATSIQLRGIERFKVYLSQDGPNPRAQELAHAKGLAFMQRPHENLLRARQGGTEKGWGAMEGGVEFAWQIGFEIDWK